MKGSNLLFVGHSLFLLAGSTWLTHLVQKCLTHTADDQIQFIFFCLSWNNPGRNGGLFHGKNRKITFKWRISQQVMFDATSIDWSSELNRISILFGNLGSRPNKSIQFRSFCWVRPGSNLYVLCVLAHDHYPLRNWDAAIQESQAHRVSRTKFLGHLEIQLRKMKEADQFHSQWIGFGGRI